MKGAGHLWLLSFALAGVRGSAAQEARWVWVATSTDTTVYLDSGSVKLTSPDVVALQSKLSFAVMQQSYRGIYDNEVMRLRIRCTRSQIGLLDSRYYSGTKLSFRVNASVDRPWFN